MYNKILYALDLDSKAHLQKALAIAAQLNAQLYVGYATHMDEDYTDDEIYFGKADGDMLVDGKRKELEAKLDVLLQGTELSKEHVYVVDGPVGKAIDHLAQTLNTDLVLIAKSHRHFSLLIKPDTLIRYMSHYDLLSFN
ncbi:universal stress protein [Enterovibrio sp. ZSDZ42]|uniref:Universal stress protein n=1 Tax=Enterovibrio gelatinilyticus TaxID=2899819 RepID=A0ABT5QZ81_9GAMM|nr:universal stress protein [Enterovibrio sp. ZSDZ42]MDD1792612.1 universal stress protein [Enterovibrio sp. ZSDZ42]